VVALGALSCVAVLLRLRFSAPPLQHSESGLFTVGLLFVAALFLHPATLIGVVTPLLTTLALAFLWRALEGAGTGAAGYRHRQLHAGAGRPDAALSS
jgi:hypothetical protein